MLKKLGLLIFLLVLTAFKSADEQNNNVIYYSVEEAVEKGSDAERLCLGGQGIEVLPQDFCKLNYMREINISANKFSEIPDCIQDFKLLRDLSASGNDITDLPRGFENLPNLESLSLSSCYKLNWDNAIIKIGKLKKLRFLDISFNDMDSIPHVELLKNVNEIILGGNKFTPEYITTLKRILKGKQVSY